MTFTCHVSFQFSFILLQFFGLSLSLKVTLLGFNSHTIKFTLLNKLRYNSQLFECVLISGFQYSHRTATFTTNPVHVSSHSPSPPPCLCQLLISFLCYRFDCFGYFIWMNSCNVWPFVSGFFLHIVFKVYECYSRYQYSLFFYG